MPLPGWSFLLPVADPWPQIVHRPFVGEAGQVIFAGFICVNSERAFD